MHLQCISKLRRFISFSWLYFNYCFLYSWIFSRIYKNLYIRISVLIVFHSPKRIPIKIKHMFLINIFSSLYCLWFRSICSPMEFVNSYGYDVYHAFWSFIISLLANKNFFNCKIITSRLYFREGPSMNVDNSYVRLSLMSGLGFQNFHLLPTPPVSYSNTIRDKRQKQDTKEIVLPF